MEYLNHENVLTRQSGSADGFRLERLEVYNWGTFNHQIWPMSPHCGTSLLTGANGSGKSTLVDALLTLLVPYHKRTYNQASGHEKHRERDERTYILGAWSKQKDSISNRARLEYLRNKGDYTVLLVVFHNAHLLQDVTLAQVLRIQDDDIDRIFAVAPCKLNIEQHFRLTGTMTELRKQLRAKGVEVYNDFAHYNRHFRRLINVRSEKAFDLFNQTVSIKEIGGLNGFVRRHMLEKNNAAKRIADLRANFENLTRAHAAILLAQKQIEILEPLVESASQYDKQQRRITEAQRCSELVPLYIAGRKKALLEAAIASAQQELAEQQGRRSLIQQELEALDKDRIDLNAAIRNDQIEQQIEQIKRKHEYYRQQQETKYKAAKRYHEIIRLVNLPLAHDEHTFYETRKQIESLLEQGAERMRDLINERDSYVGEAARLKQECVALEEEFASLKHRHSQIPGPDIAIRKRMVEALGIAEGELPFIGELLRVREHEQRWEAAIERLLRGFGRQLLVPECYYAQVSHYVDQTNLQGRLVYHRVATAIRTPRNNNSRSDRNMLYNKLEVKPDTPFRAWLTAEVVDTYDYLCCETVEAFQSARRALTMKGQVKHGPVRHEKDDRSPLGDRKSYVLGWNNVDKLAALQEELSQRVDALLAVQANAEEIGRRQHREQDRQQHLKRLREFEHFITIDWKTEEHHALALQAQIDELMQQSSVATLRQQLAEVESKYNIKQKEKENVNKWITTLENGITNHTRLREECERVLVPAPNSTDLSLLALIEKEQRGKTLTLTTIEQANSDIILFYNRRLQRLQADQAALGQSIVRLMGEFRQTSTAIAQEIDASLAAIEHYRDHYQRIRREDLPRHQKRFKDLLNDEVILDINSFKVALEEQEREIKASITRLNTSLNAIDYTPLTYIQLCHERAYDKEVSDFRTALRACLPDVSQHRTQEANEASFQRIRALIERFEKDERWTIKVTDVRNWLDFSAQELYREDGKLKHYYSDSSGKSGGQKTKLAYTILASAIAYQYGLDQEGEHKRAFRFVVVDEAFSKSDEMNARYAMELFRQLDLQLLVVTPLDKIHVIEPYISACHYVVNNEDENDSKVYNLTIEEYFQRKQALQTQAVMRDYAN